MWKDKTNDYLKQLILGLKKKGGKWKEIAYHLEKPRKKWVEVNVYKLNGKKKVIVVGKVLGSGKIKNAVEVVAYAFSESAKKKIEEAGGKAIPLSQFDGDIGEYEVIA